MSVVIRTVQDVAAGISARIAQSANHLFPPTQRERALESLRAFSVRNPKLAFFLAAQIALAGLPILLFLTFAVSTLAVSLITCIFLGVIAACVFTLLVNGFALLFVTPVVCIGSCAAGIAFVWGLLGYLVLQRINGGETPVQPVTKDDDRLNGLTDGSLHDLVGQTGADPQQERLVVDSPRGKELSMEQRGHRAHNSRSRSPYRRQHGQADRPSHGGEAGGQGQEGGAGGICTGTGNVINGTRGYMESQVITNDHTSDKVADWKTEFQRGGITT